MRFYTTAMGCVSALLLLTAPVAAADTTPQTLSVVGTGSAFVRPDVADLSVSVSRTAASSRQALSRTNSVANAVVRAARALGIADADIQTQQVNVDSADISLGRPRHKHNARLWTATESLDFRVRNIKLLGTLIDRSTTAGASSITGPSYSFSDPSAGKIAATRAAVLDARRRADDALAAMGYKVTGVQSVQLDPGSQVLPSAAAAPASSSGSSSTPTKVTPGTEEVDAQVDVVYTIGPV